MGCSLNAGQPELQLNTATVFKRAGGMDLLIGDALAPGGARLQVTTTIQCTLSALAAMPL